MNLTKAVKTTKIFSLDRGTDIDQASEDLFHYLKPIADSFGFNQKGNPLVEVRENSTTGEQIFFIEIELCCCGLCDGTMPTEEVVQRYFEKIAEGKLPDGLGLIELNMNICWYNPAYNYQ